MSEDKKKNPCGSDSGIFKWLRFPSKWFLGLDISECCEIHDDEVVERKTWSNKRFMKNIMEKNHENTLNWVMQNDEPVQLFLIQLGHSANTLIAWIYFIGVTIGTLTLKRK